MLYISSITWASKIQGFQSFLRGYFESRVSIVLFTFIQKRFMMILECF